jgi:hypothetical protein
MDRASQAQAAADLLAAARAAIEESYGPGSSGTNPGSALVGAIAQAIAIEHLASELSAMTETVSCSAQNRDLHIGSVGASVSELAEAVIQAGGSIESGLESIAAE